MIRPSSGPVPDPDNFWRCWICGAGGSPARGWTAHYDAVHAAPAVGAEDAAGSLWEQVERVVGEWWDSVGVVVRATSPHPLDDLANRILALPALRELAAVSEVAVEDVRAILAALELGTHARPYSAHDVVHREVLPALRDLATAAEQRDRLRKTASVALNGLEGYTLSFATRAKLDALRRALDGEVDRG